jgi:transketolase N-terminal domain/subunit
LQEEFRIFFGHTAGLIVSIDPLDAVPLLPSNAYRGALALRDRIPGEPSMSTDITQLSINTIRTLSMDAVQAANSGHPGTPMALAPVAYTVWQRFLRYDPAQPLWPDRDRFVLSCGHASMLLYSVLHLAGVREVDHHGKLTGNEAVSLEDIKRFRQLDSKTPGHPEYGHTTGVETTTGPLGQGVATSVGMAMAQRWLAGHFNKPGFDLFTHKIYVLCSDGDVGKHGIGFRPPDRTIESPPGKSGYGDNAVNDVDRTNHEVNLGWVLEQNDSFNGTCPPPPVEAKGHEKATENGKTQVEIPLPVRFGWLRFFDNGRWKATDGFGIEWLPIFIR